MSPRPDLGPKPRLGYVDSAIDRAAQKRSDPAALSALQTHGSTRTYVISGEMIVLQRAAANLDPLFAPSQMKLFAEVTEVAFLGLRDGSPRFAAALAPNTAAALEARTEIALADLRSIALRGLVGAEHLPPLAEAKALLGWHSRHRFCPNCGAHTIVGEAGWRRDCPSCGRQHFPRTDPVVIMLAVDGERCVLGRSHRFQPGMWSCLAGFVEPGETIEEAVRRETREETGIACGRVAYFASQPWPFPTSLMIGCHAEARSADIVIDPTELADARWFPRAEVASMLAQSHPLGFIAPQPHAIAYHIIREWIENGLDFD
jgi:NAD+ diphosphatase